MKKINLVTVCLIARKLFFAMILVFAGSAFASTAVYVDGDLLRASLGGGNDSMVLFQALNLPENQGRSGSSKVFKTNDGMVEIYCTKSVVPVGIPYACTVSLNYKGKSADTPVYQEGDFIRVSINNAAESKALFELLGLEEFAGRSGSSKVFKANDGMVEIYCTKSVIPVGIPYGCTVSIFVK